MGKYRILLALVVCLILGPLSGVFWSSSSGTYDATRLGWPNHTNMRVTGLNDSGQIVGYSGSNSYLWEEGSLYELQLPPGAESPRAFDINSSGAIVGACKLGDYILPVIWINKDAMPQLLPLPQDCQSGTARGINDAGVIVGYVSTGLIPNTLTEFYHAMFEAVYWEWDDAQNDYNPNLLPYFDPGTGFAATSSLAIAINNAGYIVGGSNTYDADGKVLESRGVVWKPGDDTYNDPIQLDLWTGRDRWTDSHRMDINNPGDITSITNFPDKNTAGLWLYQVDGSWLGPIEFENAYTGQVGIADRHNDIARFPGGIVQKRLVLPAVWTVALDGSTQSWEVLPLPSDLTHPRAGGVANFMNADGWIVGTTDNDDSSTRDVTLWVPVVPTNSPPTADFSFTTDGLTVYFTDESTDSDGFVADWSWNFGDGNTSTAQNPIHTYTASGTYMVSLTVTDDEGATGSTSKNVTVSSDQEPEPGDLSIDRFDLTNTSNPQFARVRVDWAVSGNNLTEVKLEISGPNYDSRTWNVSGDSASGQHEFSFRRGFGDYSVTLTVTDASGSLSETKDITL